MNERRLLDSLAFRFRLEEEVARVRRAGGFLRVAVAAHPRRPAILMSGHDANHEAILEALGMGPVMFVRKPMSSTDVDSALEMFRELVPGMVRRGRGAP